MEDVAAPRARPRRARVLWAWLPVALYCGLIFIGSSMPSRDLPSGAIWRFDKVIHFCEYAVLGVLIARAFTLGPPRLARWQAALLALALGVAYGASDELHQRYTPGRDSSGLDLLADTLGAAVGGAAWTLTRRRR